MTKIIVGVEDAARSRDAVAFARTLAGAEGTRIILANAYPHGCVPSRDVSAEFDHRLHAYSEATLIRLRREGPDLDVETRALADPSPARALHELAEAEGAALIVVGSSERGAIGRVLAGTTAERLLHGSPCPVAVVPQDFRFRAEPIRTVVVAYDGTEEAKAALKAAVALGRAWCAAVRAVHVIEPTYAGAAALAAGASYLVPPDELVREAQAGLQAELAALDDAGRVQAEVVLGDAVKELATRSESADLLVTGSRGYGPYRAVWLGSVSGRLVREAACPVLVLPRGASTHMEELARSSAATGRA